MGSGLRSGPAAGEPPHHLQPSPWQRPGAHRVGPNVPLSAPRPLGTGEAGRLVHIPTHTRTASHSYVGAICTLKINLVALISGVISVF